MRRIYSIEDLLDFGYRPFDLPNGEIIQANLDNGFSLYINAVDDSIHDGNGNYVADLARRGNTPKCPYTECDDDCEKDSPHDCCIYCPFIAECSHPCSGVNIMSK
jgi:hypothetical protein